MKYYPIMKKELSKLFMRWHHKFIIIIRFIIIKTMDGMFEKVSIKCEKTNIKTRKLKIANLSFSMIVL